MTDTIKKIASEIKAWDKKDVHDLRSMLSDILDECKVEAERIDDYTTDAHELFIRNVDLTSLPSCEFPEDFNTLECWAMDESGYVLCGDDLNNIEHISELK